MSISYNKLTISRNILNFQDPLPADEDPYLFSLTSHQNKIRQIDSERETMVVLERTLVLLVQLAVLLVLVLHSPTSNGWIVVSLPSSSSTKKHRRNAILQSHDGFRKEEDVTAGQQPSSSSSLSSATVLTRRKWMEGIILPTSAVATAVAAAVLIGPTTMVAAKPSNALDELPMEFRTLTRLAPLGELTTTTKTYNISLEELAKRLTHDLLYGSTETVGSYLLSGDISDDIFRDNCSFIDPNNRVDSLNQCKTALRILFDPQRSTLQIIEPLTIDTDSYTIRGKIRVRGFLQFPWNPYISSYESDIMYRVGKEDGLIYEQNQKWSKSATEALQESFTPTIYTPPPKSTIEKQENEPLAITKLFEYVNGRRPNEYSDMERNEIDILIDTIANGSTLLSKPVPDYKSLLPGKWMLVYLQPGPNGEGIDRRIPFPEFPFNDNYQIFGTDSVTNIGELFGPNLFVKVSGTLSPEMTGEGEDSVGQQQLLRRLQQQQRRFRANINQGKLCLSDTNCILDLPISGEGLFDSVYLGDRLRIGQNLNGGGARVVQVRILSSK